MSSSKSIAALAFTAALASGGASAADLGARPYYTKAPAIVDTLYNWGGFYAGGHVSASSTTPSWGNTANTTLFGDLAPGEAFRQWGTAAFGGCRSGTNWQASPAVSAL